MKLFVILAIVAGAAGLTYAADEKAATPAASAEAKPAATIPLEVQMEFFRTDGVLSRLKADTERANAEYDAAVKAILKACGEGSGATLTEDKKHLYCTPTVSTAAATAKK